MRIEAIQTCHTRTETSCESPGCIVFYKGNHCMFCDAAKEALSKTLSLYGVSYEVVYEIDVDRVKDSDSISDIVVLPSIRICSKLITGFPDEHVIGTALVRALLTGCFNTSGSCPLAQYMPPLASRDH